MLRYPLIWFVKLWRKIISPCYGDVCKYYPSCSTYALTALETHGAIKGTWLTIRRVLRCHPWAEGGFDYVPGTQQFAICKTYKTSSGNTETDQRGVK